MNKQLTYKVWILLSILFFLFVDSKSQNTLVETNLPIVSLQSNGQTITADSSIVIAMGIIYNGPGAINNISDPFNNYDGFIQIKRRGNTSLTFPKSSYTIETQDSNGQNLNISLIDLPKENDWILYGPYSDKSLMRNVLIYELSRRMGQYAPRTRHCELLLDGNYMGVYVLIEKIKQDKNRVDIAKLTHNDTVGNELTGGYIIKKDGFEGEGWNSNINWNVYFGYYYPDDDDILEVQKNYIKQFINRFEYTLDTLTVLNDTTLTSIIDFNSFYDHIILNELSKNVDAYRRSTFMHKDKNSNESTLKMGPIWDYNIAFGNNHDFNGYTTSDFIYSDTTFNSVSIFWFRKLMSFPLFRANIENRWTQLRSTTLHIDSIYSIIDSCYNFLSEAQERNFTKWDILGKYVWPNYYIGDTYEEEIEILKVWITSRFDWIEENIMAENPALPEGNSTIQIYPNPFINQFSLRINDPKIKSVTFVLYDSYGRETYRKKVKDYYLLQNEIHFNLAELNLSNGFYIYHIICNDNIMEQGKLVKFE